jgi:magnesium chelatase family protein
MTIAAPLTSEAAPALQWIEVASSLQIPSFQIIGLPAPEVAEARERIRASFQASGLDFPRRRVVVNLSPASIRKRGTGLDLAMALAVLASAEDRRTDGSGLTVAWGELGLDGRVKGAGQLARALFAAWEAQATRFVLSREELPTALRVLALIRRSGEFPDPAPALLPVRTLQEAREKLRQPAKPGALSLAPEPPEGPGSGDDDELPADASLMSLSPALERVVAIASAGEHHLLVLGPKGTGKSHSMEWRVALQPPAPDRTRLRQLLIREMTGSREAAEPIRRVSAQARPAALIGGANLLSIRPGEASLAHGGILVADELPEWARDTREALREPLERGAVTLSRAHRVLELPASFSLAANGNLCPCGGWPPQLPIPLESQEAAAPPRCGCGGALRLRYLQRLSGPILDRIDLVFLTTGGNRPEPAALPAGRDRLRELRDRVAETRSSLVATWGAPPGRLGGSRVEELLRERPHWRAGLARVSGASLRGRHKLVRVALTLSRWDGLAEPGAEHFLEASCYRAERFGLSA